MTEQEFLEKRIPIWLEGDELHISTPGGQIEIVNTLIF